MTKRRLAVAFSLAVATAATLVAFVLPASAELRKLTLTLLNGQQVTVTLDVPPGTPLDQIRLPALTSPVVAITDDGNTGSPGAPPVTIGPTGSGTTGSSGSSPNGLSGPGSSQTTGSATSPAISGQTPQQTTGRKHRKPGLPQPALTPRLRRPAAARSHGLAATPLRAANGVPTLGNPTLSIALPGPAAIGVPDFFIDKFRIPPFLLPIYQAAAIEYDVPWQVLAAINEIETDYGRDLSVSSAGALGWMQFLPATWKQYGVDATQSGVKDPYNPVDAVFSAARYLHAAGASTDLRGAIFAYNHATWYVDSVLLRAKLIGGLPPDLVGSLTGLTEGHFPVHAKATYADDLTEKKLQAGTAQSKSPTVLDQANPSRTGIDIFAKSGSPVVAVQDGEIVKIAHNKKLGSYMELRDAYGNMYTYAQLHQIAKLYPVARPQTVSRAQVASELGLPGTDPKPTLPASAGHQPTQSAATGVTGAAGAATGAATGAVDSATTTATKVLQATDQAATQERLFAHPSRPASFAAGGRDQLDALGTGLPGLTSFSSYFTQVFGLKRTDVVLHPLKVGSRVIAGTILGRVGPGSNKSIASHVLFEIRPAGRGAPRIDPKPILDGWRLLEATALYRSSNANPFFGPHAKNPTIGQILLMSKEALQRRVLADPNVQIYACGRRDIEAGAEDRRVLAVLEYLSASGLKPTVTALRCGAPTTGKAAAGAADLAAGDALDIAKINGVMVLGHQGPGSIADIAVHRLIALQGLFKPYEIVSLMTYPGTDNTIARRDYTDRVHVGYLPQYDPHTKFGRQVDSVLRPQQWLRLIARLDQIPNPAVSAAPSPYAIPDTGALAGASGH